MRYKFFLVALLFLFSVIPCSYGAVHVHERFDNFTWYQWQTTNDWEIVAVNATDNSANKTTNGNEMYSTNGTLVGTHYGCLVYTIRFWDVTSDRRAYNTFKTGGTNEFQSNLICVSGGALSIRMYSYDMAANPLSFGYGTCDTNWHKFSFYRNSTDDDWSGQIDNSTWIKSAYTDSSTWNYISFVSSSGLYKDYEISDIVWADTCAEADAVLWDHDEGPTPPPPPGGINLTNSSPAEGTNFNTQNISFSTVGDFLNWTNCTLYIDGDYNETKTGYFGNQTLVNFSDKFLDTGTNTYEISCINNQSNGTTGNITFYIDINYPGIVDDFINHSMYFEKNLTAQFNLSDDIILSRFNISIDGNSVYTKALSSSSYQLNWSYNVSYLSVGNHTMHLLIADGHTKKKLKDPDGYKSNTNRISHKLKYSIRGDYDPMDIEIEHINGSFFDSWEVYEKTDRFSEKFNPYNKKSVQKFRVTSTKSIRIITDERNHYGGKWLITGDHWRDFVIPNQPAAKVKYKRVDDKTVDVTISQLEPDLPIEFDSLGDINILNFYHDFYRINMSTSYDDIVFAGFAYDFNLSVDFGELMYNWSNFTSPALFENDGKNYTSTQTLFNSTNAKYRIVFGATYNSSQLGVIDFNWHFNMTNFTKELLSLAGGSYNRLAVEVGKCNGSLNYTILNISYADELTEEEINVTDAYDLAIYDGTYYYNQTSFWNETDDHALCTGIDPGIAQYNWYVWGTFTLSKDEYVTRIINIDEATPYTVSNNPARELQFYLIGIDNSTTVKYNWLSTNFELLDGTMRIYRCLDNGSKELIESTPVIAGAGYANIQLLLQPYSYDITVDGITYEDASGYGQCHTEATTEVTYYVDTSVVDLTSLIGLTNVECRLNKISNDTVNMVWTQNPEDSSYVSGCIIASRRQLGGLVEVYNNCSVESDGYNRSVQIPINNQEYIVSANIVQGQYQISCGEEVTFFVGRSAAELFSLTGLFCAVLLIAGVSLMYVGKVTEQLIGASVGLVAAFILALINVSWITIASFIMILIIIAIVGRVSRLE